MKSNTHVGTYTLTIDDDDNLHIQSPTLSQPLDLDTRQVGELLTWLNKHFTTSTAQRPIQSIWQRPDVPPEIRAQTAILDAIAEAHEKHPALLSPENRERLVKQMTDISQIQSLLTLGEISYTQLVHWVEQDLATAKAS